MEVEIDKDISKEDEKPKKHENSENNEGKKKDEEDKSLQQPLKVLAKLKVEML